MLHLIIWQGVGAQPFALHQNIKHCLLPKQKPIRARECCVKSANAARQIVILCLSCPVVAICTVCAPRTSMIELPGISAHTAVSSMFAMQLSGN